ncbi:hypothetical protein N7G274_005991 [Stereocaulon virgatum]|uniref:RING-type domain-containing protein n=1 Tax=Stereocaulon virgatum TaxID=373712 RepID=A0ABR4A563_9LECA
MVAQSVGADLRAFCNMNLSPDVTTHVTRRQVECVAQVGHNCLAIGMYIKTICQGFTLTATFRMIITHSNATLSSTTAIEIVLSCSVCADTLSRINAEGYEFHGLRKTDDPNSGRVTKLWLTECAHLCCTKHFEGGGVPFYPDQQAPRAPCPFCVVENNDHSEKTLFYINGPATGEYDPNIPSGYFQIPPVDLGGSDPAFAALLFQYLSLIRFGAKTNEKALRLGNSLRLWEERKTEIVRSLSNAAPLRDELLSAGRRLLSLGQDVTSIETVLNLAGASLIQGTQVHQRPGTQHQLPSTLLTGLNAMPTRPTPNVASRLANASAAELGRLTKGNPSLLDCERNPVKSLFSRDGFPAKRKLVDSLDELEWPFDRHHSSRAYGKTPSRDLMPPPPLPMRNPFVFMVNTDDNDHGESNGGGISGERSQGNAACETPQRPPSQDSAHGSGRRYSDTTLASEPRSRPSFSSTSTAAYEGPLRHGQLNRRRAEVHGDRPHITDGEGHRISRAQSLASQAASISDLSDPGAPPALRNQAASRQVSPTGQERSLHSRANSNQAGPTSRYFTPSRERTHSTPHRQQLGSTPMARSQSDSIGVHPDETSRGRSRTPAPFSQHRRALDEQSPTPSADVEAEDLPTPRHNRRRADR